ncbi:PE family protein [Nocardia sp. NPDC052112]|uniref:PE family protein n=1 Tax=Nocardia sp. NPDC052112 TaxID=3155646 RepID=UPI00341D2EFD
MYLDLISAELPAIASRLGISAADLMAMLDSAAIGSVPLPPGFDDVSACIPTAFGAHAVSFFPVTATGVMQGIDGAVTLPEVGIAYTSCDAQGEGQVISEGVFGK